MQYYRTAIDHQRATALVKACVIDDCDVWSQGWRLLLTDGSVVSAPLNINDRPARGDWLIYYANGESAVMNNADFIKAYRQAEGAQDTEPSRTTYGFGWAIEQMYSGARVTRRGWNGKGQWIAIQNPTETSWMRRPYIFISPVGGDRVPWVASQSDLLTHDWELENPGPIG